MNDHADKRGRNSEKKGVEETGHSMRFGAMGFHLGKRRTAAATTSARDADDKTMRLTTADTLVAHEERDKPCLEEKAGIEAESGQVAVGDSADTTPSGPALETQEHKIRWNSSNHLPPQNQDALSGKMISQTPPDKIRSLANSPRLDKHENPNSANVKKKIPVKNSKNEKVKVKLIKQNSYPTDFGNQQYHS